MLDQPRMCQASVKIPKIDFFLSWFLIFILNSKNKHLDLAILNLFCHWLPTFNLLNLTKLKVRWLNWINWSYRIELNWILGKVRWYKNVIYIYIFVCVCVFFFSKIARRGGGVLMLVSSTLGGWLRSHPHIKRVIYWPSIK